MPSPMPAPWAGRVNVQTKKRHFFWVGETTRMSRPEEVRVFLLRGTMRGLYTGKLQAGITTTPLPSTPPPRVRGEGQAGHQGESLKHASTERGEGGGVAG